VQQDDDAVGVAEEALVLLHAQPREGAAELGEQRAAEEFRQREIVEFGKLCLEVVFALARIRGADAQNVNQRASRIPDGLENLLEAAAAIVFDHDARPRRQVGFEVGVGAPKVSGDDLHAPVVQTPGNRFALDEEFNLETGQQDLVEHPDGQLGLADGETPHGSFA